MTKSTRMHDELASYYDRICSEARYGSEARRVRAIVRRFGPPRARTLLDVVCGTEGHLQYFQRWYAAQGIGACASMLRLAR